MMMVMIKIIYLSKINANPKHNIFNFNKIWSMINWILTVVEISDISIVPVKNNALFSVGG